MLSQLQHSLQNLGYNPANTPQPGGNYLAVRKAANGLYVAIQFPIFEQQFQFQGRLGAELTTQQGYTAARMAAAIALFQIEKFNGLAKIASINHMDFYYQASADWDEGPEVANGASDLFVEVLGEVGQHSRAILGVAQLPRNFSVGLTVVCSLG